MSWWDSLSSGDTAFGFDSFSGGSDWNWSDLLGGDSGGGSGWGDLLGGVVGGLFGGGSGGGSNSSNNLWASLLGGLGGAAQGYLSGKDLKENTEAKGKEDRKTSKFEAELLDYYKQKDKVRKRAALDTYGQFSLAKRINSPGVDMPNMPSI